MQTMTTRVQLQEAFKLALSMMLFYWLALWMNWDLPKFGALAIIVVSLSTTGASLNKGVMRVAGTGQPVDWASGSVALGIGQTTIEVVAVDLQLLSWKTR